MPLTDRGMAAREHAIGSSDVGALFDHDDFGRTESDVYARVVAGILPAASERMALGNDLESFLVRLAQRRLGVRLRSAVATYRHPTLPFVAHTDALALDPIDGLSAVVECKNVSRWNAPDWDDGPTPAVVDQVQTAMLLSGRQLAVVVALVAGGQLQIYRIPADPVRQAEIVDRVAAFVREHVEPRIPPDDIPGELLLTVTAPSGSIGVDPDTALDEAGLDMVDASQARLDAQKAESAARGRLAKEMVAVGALKATSPFWMAEGKPRDDGSIGLSFRRRSVPHGRKVEAIA